MVHKLAKKIYNILMMFISKDLGAEIAKIAAYRKPSMNYVSEQSHFGNIVKPSKMPLSRQAKVIVV